MKLIDQKWNPHCNKYERTWLADDASDIASDFDNDSAYGSVIIVISTGELYIKNTTGKWQKNGTSEVIG